jgi:two-component system cell cycle sensor histidine kinase/response regulator CckA
VNEAIRLLYAEDSRTDSDLTREHFAIHAPDIQIDVVETGEACLARVEHGQHDALLLDNRLPDMDASDVLKALTDRNIEVPVVVATAVGDEELVVRLVRLGAWDYVAKDGDYIQRLPAVLRSAIAEYGRRHAQGYAVRRRPRRVLYIERHPADIDLTARHMAEHAPHVHVEIVRSSKEALARLNDSAFDLVLTDLRMPDMNALDLLRELRHRALSVPVVVVTGKGDETAAVAALKLGAYDYIVKRDDYLTQLPYALDNAIDRFQLAEVNQRLQTELAERERMETERTRLAEQLRQAQKIDSLGRLAGGVAHDFNNLLTVIAGHADLMLQDLDENDPLRESVGDIKSAATRAADLTRQLLAFSRRQILRPRVVDLNDTIRESTRMLRRLLGEDVELVTLLDPGLGRVKADPGQLDQVIVNLAVNARDAMPQGGKLTIETRNVAIEQRDAQRHVSFQPGSYVLIAISDSGVGMNADILPHIFEPFFTTKEQGKGTGLGLSMVYGIVKQSGGWIWVYSEPGHGTTVKVYLPRVEPPLTEVEERPAEIESPRGGETILVVEDEEAVRKLTCHILRKYGYDVIETANGGEALLTCERHVLPIPLLLTDVVMPRMSGPALAARLRQLHPEMKVLYTSGYTDAAVVDRGLLDQSVSFLQKPFTPSELGRKVREVLDSPAS